MVTAKALVALALFSVGNPHPLNPKWLTFMAWKFFSMTSPILW